MSPNMALGSCPTGWCKSGGGGFAALRRVWPVSSGCHGGQLDQGIIAQRCDGFQCHVAGPLDRPFIILLEQDGAGQAGNGVLIGEDADDLGAALDLAVQPFQRIGRVDLGPGSLGKLIKASTSVSASSIWAASLATLGLI